MMKPLMDMIRLACALCLVAPLVGQSSEKSVQVLYETGFETSEGYDFDKDLIGQNGWIGFAGGDAYLEESNDGASGLISDFLEGLGQHAYIGFVKPAHDTDISVLSLLQPLNYDPEGSAGETVRFSVTMAILDSTNGERDNFRWSVYNTDGFRLFSLDFDNETKQISYALDDAKNLQDTGFNFDNDTIYDLRMDIDLVGNKWTALAGDVILVKDQPVTTQNLKRDLSDIDAVWAIFKADAPGDNYMVFDNYRVEVLSDPPPPPVLSPLGPLPNGGFVLRLEGAPGTQYRIMASSDLSNWETLEDAVDLGATGTLDWVDDTAPAAGQRYYRLLEKE